MPKFAISRTIRTCATALLLALLPMHATAQATTQLYTWKDADGQVTIKNTPVSYTHLTLPTNREV